jgi:hypothetical protein
MIGAFVQEAAEVAAGNVTQACEQRWLFFPDNSQLVIQLEALASGKALLYASLARDGNGALLSAFMSTLFIEDIHAIKTQDDIFCVARGSVSLTFFTTISAASPSLLSGGALGRRFLLFMAEVGHAAGPLIPSPLLAETTRHPEVLSKLRLDFLVNEGE